MLIKLGIFFVLLSLSLVFSAAFESSDEYEALMDLYKATNGPNWKHYQLLLLVWRNLQ